MALKGKSVPSAEYAGGTSKWYGALFKIVKTLIETSDLKTRFDVFEDENIEVGNGYETSIILAQKGQDSAGDNPETNNKYEEHGYYKANTVNIVNFTTKPRQYAVTVKDSEIAKIMNNKAKMVEFAEKLVNSLYQGWTDDKNKYVAEAIKLLQTKTANVQNITITPDIKEYSLAMLAAIMGTAATFREGIEGEQYGNNEIGKNSIASNEIVVLINPNTYALLKVYGLAEAFHRGDRETDVTFIESARLDENTAIVTDKRNISTRKRWEDLVKIPNSDGSWNFFYNTDWFIDYQVTNSTTQTPAFPAKIITGVEAAR